jgi:hypothetical protein
MNKRIQELAEHCTIQYRDGHGGYVDHVDVEKFAELIAAAEREACAKLVFKSPPSDEYEPPLLAVYNAIRARNIVHENGDKHA